MEPDGFKSDRFRSKLAVCLLWALSAFGQQFIEGPQVPPNFNLDLETAARLRPQFLAQSMAVTGQFLMSLDKLLQSPRKLSDEPST